MRFLAVVMVLAVSADAATAQFPPDSLKNIQALDSTLSPRQVIGIMRGFSFGLGVRCEYCHVGEAGQPLSTFDFPSDEKPTKKKARAMIRMVQYINGDALAALPDRGTPMVDVECATCHRGQARPIMMTDLLVHVAESAGADSAAARYRQLRSEFYGSDTYDFRTDPINDAAQRLLRSGNPTAARTLLGLNEEFSQADAITAALLGQSELALGDTTAAIAHLERAAALQPENPAIRRLLNQARGRQ